MAVTPNREAGPLTGARQTMMTWARVIASADEIPAAFRAALQPLVAGRPVFPYTVFAPPQHGTRHKDTEWVLCDVDRTLYVVERARGRLTTTGYPWQTVRDIEVGNILLFAWITLSGLTTAGTAGATTVAYNYATHRHLAPFINKLRPASPGAAPADQALEQAGLAGASYKFRSFAAESVVPGAQVQQAVWQPPIRRPSAALLGFTLYRTVTLAHLTLLTDQELILIGDDERSPDKSGTQYGGVWRYIPRRHITTAAVTEQAEGLLTLTLGLTQAGRLERVFTADRRGALERLQQALTLSR